MSTAAPAFPLSGSEDVTILWRGALASPPLLPPGVVPAVDAHGHHPVGLLALRLRDLGLRGVPAPRFSYQEVLWWAAATVNGKATWFVLRCDLDRWWALPMVRTGVGYPVLQSPLVIREDALSVGNDLALRLGPQGPPVPLDVVDRLCTQRGETLLSIPFSLDGLAQGTRHALLLQRDELGARVFGETPMWEEHVVLCQGRQHACGFGSRVDVA